MSQRDKYFARVGYDILETLITDQRGRIGERAGVVLVCQRQHLVIGRQDASDRLFEHRFHGLS